MRFLIVDAYYGQFLQSLYARTPGLSRQPYQQQWRTLMDECFGVADYYSSNLRQLGHEAEEIIVNSRPLQLQWAREHRVRVSPIRYAVTLRRWHGLPIPVPTMHGRWLWKIFLSQVQAYKPDVLYIHGVDTLPQDVLNAARQHARLTVVQHASLLPDAKKLRGYDLLLSSLPNQVEYFRQAGLSIQRIGSMHCEG